ncbi:MAG: DUF4097 domain-containing protein, partial [Clostridiaceae bacterium]|nr:DUF4097 domain-containing protein [Clostridiaceae bacterium]
MYRNNQRINALPHFIRAIALLIIAGLSFATIGKGSFPIFFATGKNREFETVAEFSPGEATGVEFNLSSSELVVQSSEEVDNVVLQVSFYKKIKDETINKEQNWLRDGRIYLTDDVNPLAERSGRNWLQRHLYGYRILVPQNTSSFEVDFVSQSGELEIKDVNCGSVSAIISSGDVVLNQVEAKMIDVQSTSGDLELYDCKADRFSMQTTSGDIEG